MTGQQANSPVTATAAARQAITGLIARRGPVMFVQSGGRRGGSAAMCFPAGEFITGTGDIMLGEVAGCPFWMDAQLYDAWGRPQLILDVEPGFPAGFSLGAGPDRHFVTRTGRSGPH
jgi:uncharacterized protein (DUF779 family)